MGKRSKFGEFIRIERIKRGYTLRDVGTALSLSAMTISQVESGENKNPETALRIADYYGLNRDYIKKQFMKGRDPVDAEKIRGRYLDLFVGVK